MRITRLVVPVVPVSKTPKRKPRVLPVYRYIALENDKGKFIDVKG